MIWMISAWTLSACVVLALAIYRKVVAGHDDGLVHVADIEEKTIAQQQGIAQKLEVIDRWGKILTVIVVLAGLGLAGMYFYSVWQELGQIHY